MPQPATPPTTPPGLDKGYSPEPPPPGSTCGQCAYWRLMAGATDDGLCYRSPPTVLPIAMQVPNDGAYYHTQRPHTKANESACGEYWPSP